MKKYSILLVLIFISLTSVQAQNITQNIRGTIVDKISQAPIIGATVALSDRSKGTRTDDYGRFELKGVPIGRVSIVATYLGYQTIFLNNLELGSTKELILNLSMEEKVVKVNEVVIQAQKDKSKTINEMVTVSGRTFSIEESQRYAGSRNDVARMAQSFAGVQGSDDSRNDIVVRGNSPTGVLYRLEGMDIPNPNHFSAAGTTGGPVSMLNNNVLVNADFLTSAFPAEYMDATSGIFDLQLRNGNKYKHEFLGQFGFNGAELNAEGPSSKKNNSSYIVGYRYSTLAIFNALGINFGTGTAVPKYQDGSFKLNFTDKKGSTTLFGLGGISRVNIWDSENVGENLFGSNNQDLTYKTNTGIIGASRSYLISEKSFTKTTISLRRNSVQTVVDTFGVDPLVSKSPFYRNNSFEGAVSLHSTYQTKLSSRANIKTGFYIDRNLFRLSDSVFRADRNEFVDLTNAQGGLWVIKPYAQMQYKFSDKLTTNVGLSSVYFAKTNTISVEPRVGVQYAMTNRSKVSFGYGLHSKIPPLRAYFQQDEIAPNVFAATNDQLGLSKAHHFVVAYDYNVNAFTRLKVEAYYQSLFNIPIDRVNGSYSMLNHGVDFNVQLQDSLINKGTGENYGVELTFEHFLNKGFYYLVTASVYQSTYVPANGITYPTAFDGRYAGNILAGKEFYLSERIDKKKNAKQYSFTLDAKAMYNGGRRYTPIDLEESILAGEPIFDNSRSFSERYDPYYRVDFRIGFKMQTKKASHEWAIDIQNLLNRKNIFAVQFDQNTLSLKESYQTGFLPIMQYRIRF